MSSACPRHLPYLTLTDADVPVMFQFVIQKLWDLLTPLRSAGTRGSWRLSFCWPFSLCEFTWETLLAVKTSSWFPLALSRFLVSLMHLKDCFGRLGRCCCAGKVKQEMWPYMERETVILASPAFLCAWGSMKLPRPAHLGARALLIGGDTPLWDFWLQHPKEKCWINVHPL